MLKKIVQNLNVIEEGKNEEINRFDKKVFQNLLIKAGVKLRSLRTKGFLYIALGNMNFNGDDIPVEITLSNSFYGDKEKLGWLRAATFIDPSVVRDEKLKDISYKELNKSVGNMFNKVGCEVEIDSRVGNSFDFLLPK